MWREIVNEGEYSDSLMPVNYVMLAVISGIIGVVLAGFTGWHILLASRGQTTIECLEKTRYLSPLRKSMQHQTISNQMDGGEYGHQFNDMSPGTSSLRTNDDLQHGEQREHMTFDVMERRRARARYEEYLDEQDSEKLPSAFDLGWRRNMRHLFGPSKFLSFFPICNTTGDGWTWEPSPKWLDARERIAREREAQQTREQAAGWGAEPTPIPVERSQGSARHYVTSYPSRSPTKADRILGRSPSEYADQENSAMSMQTLRRPNAEDDYEISSDEEEADRKKLERKSSNGWPHTLRQVGVVTNTLLGNTLARQKDDVRGWDGQDEGVD